MTQQIPFELERYITAEQKEHAEANNVEHRPTSPDELARIATEATELYKAGQELIGLIQGEDPDDLARCLRLCAMRAQNQTKLVRVKVLNRIVLVPQYVRLIEEMRELRRVLA